MAEHKPLKDMNKVEIEEFIARKFAENVAGMLNGDKELTAADLNVIRQYLKDNNIQIKKGADANFDKITAAAENDSLPFKVTA